MRRSIQLTTLQYALVVAEEASLLRASRRLHIHHSALSRRIRELEHALGVKLFERHAQGVRSTAAGKRFLNNLRRVLGDLDRVLALAESAGEGATGSLSIGFYVPMLATELCNVAMSFARARPGVATRFIEAPRVELAAGLIDKTIDITIVSGSSTLSGDRNLPLWQDRVIAALPEDHRLAGGDAIDWSTLEGESIVLRSHDPGTEIKDLLFSRFALSGTPPMIVQYDISRESLLGLVRQGYGIALLYEAERGGDRDGIIYLEIRSDCEPCQVRYVANWRSDNANPVLSAFVSLLKSLYPSP